MNRRQFLAAVLLGWTGTRTVTPETSLGFAIGTESPINTVAAMLCCEAKVNPERVQTGCVSRAEHARLVKAAREMASLPVYFQETGRGQEEAS